ncbi:MAG: SMC-Scp complex subunit ScpB [Terriglobales bacterium]
MNESDARGPAAAAAERSEGELLSAIEAIVYVADEPATLEQIAASLGIEKARAQAGLAALMARYAGDEHGIEVKAVAGGYRMASKPQHHEAVRKFIKALKPPVRLSLAALETLAVIAYRQPVTAPEIKEIRGVDPSGVLNTLLEKKLIAAAGRKEVIGKPILYKTTREFLLRFGLNGLEELPTLKEFEELAMAGLEGLEPAGEPGEQTAAAPSPSGGEPTADADGPAQR